MEYALLLLVAIPSLLGVAVFLYFIGAFLYAAYRDLMDLPREQRFSGAAMTSIRVLIFMARAAVILLIIWGIASVLLMIEGRPN